VDCLIAIGSSLQVSPIKDILQFIPKTVPQILINRCSVGPANHFDYQLLGHCDIVVHALCKKFSERQTLPKWITCLLKDNSVIVPNQSQQMSRGIIRFDGYQENEDGIKEDRSSELTKCDGCGIQIFAGKRYKCNSCFDYDLCSYCFFKERTKGTSKITQKFYRNSSFTKD